MLDRRGLQRVAAPVAVAAVGVGFVAEAVQTAAAGARRPLYGDDALIELAARRAAHLDQLLGPYSRFGFHHPGPAEFYLLAPFVAAQGSGAGIWVGATVVGGAALVATAAVVARWCGAAVAGWAAGTLAVLALCLGVGILRDPWNPYVAIAPVVLAGTLAAGAAAGRRGALPWAAVAASVAAQTQIATAPAAVSLVAAAAAARLVIAARRRRDGDEGRRPPGPRRPGGWALAGGVALVAAWLPPVVEVVRDRPGNLSAIWDFFTAPHPVPGLRAAASAAAQALAVVPLGTSAYAPLRHPRAEVAVALAGLAAVALAGAVTARLRRSPLGAGLVAASAVVVAAGTLGLARAAGGIESYLTTWLAAGPTLALLGLVVAVGDPSGRPLRRVGRGGAPWAARAPLALGLAVATAGGAALGRAVAEAPTVGQQVAPVELASQELAQAVAARCPAHSTVQLLVGSHPAWPVVAGVDLALVRSGHTVTVGPPLWAPLFAPQTRTGPAPGGTYTLWSAGEQAPGSAVLAAAGGVVVTGVTALGRGSHGGG